MARPHSLTFPMEEYSVAVVQTTALNGFSSREPEVGGWCGGTSDRSRESHRNAAKSLWVRLGFRLAFQDSMSLKRIAFLGSIWERQMFTKPWVMGCHILKREVYPFTWFYWCDRWSIEGTVDSVGWFSRSGRRNQFSFMSDQLLVHYITAPLRNTTGSLYWSWN